MSVSVGTLQIDLVANTASFQSDMGKAAQVSRKGADDIKDSFDKIGQSATSSMKEARGSLMLIEGELGIHLPREMNALLASIPGLGAAFAAMLPLVGVAAAIAIIAKLITAHKEAKEAAEQAQFAHVNFGTAAQNALNGLDDKILEAGIKADELANNHLGALHKQLELIDHQTLKELEEQFGILAKAADATFAQLKASWYEFGSGSVGAKHALDEFKVKYDALIAQGKDKEAGDLLAGTLASAEKIKKLQDTANTKTSDGSEAAYMKFVSAQNELKRLGIGYSEKEVAAQQQLVDVFTAQENVAAKLNTLKQAQTTNVKTEDHQKEEKKDTTIEDAKIAGEKKIADAHAQTVQQGLALDNAAHAASIDAAIQANKEAQTFDQALFNEKRALVQKEIDDKVSAANEQFTTDSAAMSQRLSLLKKESGDHRAEIVTMQTDIEALAIKHEGDLSRIHKQGVQEVAAVDRQAAAEAAANEQLKASLIRASAEEQFRFESEMAKLRLQAEDQEAAHRLASTRGTEQQVLDARLDAENRAYKAETDALAKEVANYDKHDKEYAAKIQASDHKAELLAQQHENKLTEIKEKAEDERNKKILAAENKLADGISQNVAKSIVEGQNLADSMKRLGETMAEDALANALKMILIGDMQQAKDAGHAAASAFKWVMSDVPFPANAIIAPVAAAAAFTSVMAFEQGGIVPEDALAMVHKEEMILPKELASGLQSMIHSNSHIVSPHVDAGSNNADKQETHVHVDARGADAGVEARVHRAIRQMGDHAVARSVAAVNDRAGRR